MEDNYRRFSRVAENYARYRPGYPRQLLDMLSAECGLTPDHSVADIGSGTGLLTELFLQHGNRVYGVEPNPEMRAAAEQRLSAYSRFTSLAATAEATSLPEHSIDMISAGQAFHWFDHQLTHREFLRILVPHGWVVLAWNLLGFRPSPFADAFEQFWQTYIDRRTPPGTAPRHPRARPDYITTFFGAAGLKEQGLENDYVCDYAALKGYTLSASGSPQPDDPRYPAMLDELRALFEQYQQAGTVTLPYETRVVYGRLSA